MIASVVWVVLCYWLDRRLALAAHYANFIARTNARYYRQPIDIPSLRSPHPTHSPHPHHHHHYAHPIMSAIATTPTLDRSAAPTCYGTPSPTQGSLCYSNPATTTTAHPVSIVHAWSIGISTVEPSVPSVLRYSYWSVCLAACIGYCTRRILAASPSGCDRIECCWPTCAPRSAPPATGSWSALAIWQHCAALMHDWAVGRWRSWRSRTVYWRDAVAGWVK